MTKADRSLHRAGDEVQSKIRARPSTPDRLAELRAAYLAELSRKAMCSVRGLIYDRASRTGRLYMTANHCCDMSGCLDIFKAIDPAVRHVKTFMGEDPDTQYHFDERWKDAGNWRHDGWQAFDSHRDEE